MPEGAEPIKPEWEFLNKLQTELQITTRDLELLELLAYDERLKRGETFRREAKTLGIDTQAVENRASAVRLKLIKAGILPPTHNDTDALIYFYREKRASIR